MTEHFSDSTVVLNTLYRLAEVDPRAALERLAESDGTFADQIHYKAFRPGVLINAGAALNDSALIREGLDLLAALLDSSDPRLSAWRRALFYNLGNGYSELAARGSSDGVDPDNPILQETKHAYRNAIAADEGGGNPQLLAEVYTNYGNALSACGRHYEALLSYDRALSVHPTHSMALGNKGIELKRYAVLARNQSGLLLAEAYELCRAGAADQSLDDRGLASARSIFVKHRDSLEPVYTVWRARLEGARRRKLTDSHRTREEQHHHSFAVEHDL